MCVGFCHHRLLPRNFDYVGYVGYVRFLVHIAELIGRVYGSVSGGGEWCCEWVFV